MVFSGRTCATRSTSCWSPWSAWTPPSSSSSSWTVSGGTLESSQTCIWWDKFKKHIDPRPFITRFLSDTSVFMRTTNKIFVFLCSTHRQHIIFWTSSGLVVLVDQKVRIKATKFFCSITYLCLICTQFSGGFPLLPVPCHLHLHDRLRLHDGGDRPREVHRRALPDWLQPGKWGQYHLLCAKNVNWKSVYKALR